MAHTDRGTVLAQAIYNLILAAQSTLNVDYVLYGDHNNIPGGKAITVAWSGKTRTLQGVSAPGGVTLNEIEVLVKVYYSMIEAEDIARLAVDSLAEDVEDLLHTDTTVGGLVIHGFVRNMTPGAETINDSMFRVVEMTFTAQTKTRLVP